MAIFELVLQQMILTYT